ncbi:MAG TPA: hypothetical protein VHE83_12850 [Mycobacteriales bacterium]|nr:hypothetical protein [Mycobacteriales bacterium]
MASRRWLTWLLAVLAALPVSVAPTSAAARAAARQTPTALAPGEVVLPAAPDGKANEIDVAAGTDDALVEYRSPAYNIGEATLRLRDGATYALGDTPQAQIVGNVLYTGAWGAGHIGTAWSARLMPNGVAHPLGAVRGGGGGEVFLSGTGDGWLAGASTVMLHRFDGTSRELDYFGGGAQVTAASADRTGAAIAWSAPDAVPGPVAPGFPPPPSTPNGGPGAGYVDFTDTSGELWHNLHPLPANASGPVALTTDSVYYYDAAAQHVVQASRADLSTVRTWPTGGPITNLAVTATGLAWTSADGHPVTCSAARCVASDAALGEVVPWGDGFAEVWPGDASTAGIYAVNPGAAGRGPLVSLAGSVGPQSIYAAPGFVGYQEPIANRLRARQIAVRRTGGALVATPLPALPATPVTGTRPSVSGGRVAILRQVRGMASELVVYDTTAGGAVLFRRRFQATPMNPTLSGNRVSVCWGIQKTWVYDLAAPQAAPLELPGCDVIDGDRAVRKGARTSVWLHDLAHPDRPDVELRPPVTDAVDGLQAPDVIQIRGDWVLWGFSQFHDGNIVDSTYATAVHLRPDDSVDRTVSLPVPAREVRLLDGSAVVLTSDDHTVHVIDLGSGADTEVGLGHLFVPGRYYLAADDDFIAWIGDDGNVHLLPNPAVAGDGPRLLGVLAPKLVRNRAAVLRVMTSRTLTTWTMTLRSARGHIAMHRHGTSLTGGVSVRWNGARTAAAGTYQWTFTASAAGRSLVGRDGRHTTARGTLVVAH